MSPIPCQPVLPTHSNLARVLSELEQLCPADECRQASENTLHNLTLLLSVNQFSAENPFFSLLKATRDALWQEGSRLPSAPPAAP